MSVLESSEEKINGFKLMRLIVDGGTETKKIITQLQWDKLFPPPPGIPNIQEFYITLLVILLRNICGLSPSSTGWNVMPGSTDNSREANIVRIRLFRNNLVGHVPGTDVNRLDFEAHWIEVGSALRSLGINQPEINRLKAEECGEEEVNRVRTEWNESEREVSTWLNDAASDNRAFIIPGQAGMEYKKNLSCKLSSSKGQILDELNIEGLFRMLFKEPLTNIPDPGKHFLIAIDALDECQQEERYEFVDLITRHFHKFPRFIRFLTTTRSEKDIALKFRGLNRMFLVPEDKRNLSDLRLFFVDKLSTTMRHPSQEELVKNLVKQSEGLMLYASFLCKLSKDGSIKSSIESLPEGIEVIYETYFVRLENELKILGIEEEKFLSLLSVLAVAKQPLPSSIIKRLLSSERDSLSAERTLSKLISCISSLLFIKDDCVSFSHKSVKDWLVKPNHRFTIKEKYGHKTLADICVFQMETLKQNE
ncbi:Hypothetical predicted protein, partial [Paramuricea clavata]